MCKIGKIYVLMCREIVVKDPRLTRFLHPRNFKNMESYFFNNFLFHYKKYTLWMIHRYCWNTTSSPQVEYNDYRQVGKEGRRDFFLQQQGRGKHAVRGMMVKLILTITIGTPIFLLWIAQVLIFPLLISFFVIKIIIIIIIIIIILYPLVTHDPNVLKKVTGN